MNLHDNPPLYFECRVVHTPRFISILFSGATVRKSRGSLFFNFYGIM